MPDEQLLKSYLAERDVPCPSCGYNLRGLAAAACPECRQALTLNVALQRPETKSWLATIITLWIVGVGAAVAMAILMIVAGKYMLRDLAKLILGTSSDRLLWMLVVYPTIGAMVLTPIACWLTTSKGRRWFTNTPRQRLVRNLCMYVSVGAVVIWTAWLYSKAK